MLKRFPHGLFDDVRASVVRRRVDYEVKKSVHPRNQDPGQFSTYPRENRKRVGVSARTVLDRAKVAEASKD